MIVIKRDGRKVEFDKSKVRESVLKAYAEVDGEIDAHAREKASEIARYVESLGKALTVEEIQNEVENKLMASNRKDVARAYIIYRSTRSRVRERNSAWVKAIKDKLLAKDVQNQNANVDEKSFGGRKGEADSELMKKLALDDYMSEMSRNNHINNEIYIHDLDSYVVGMHNCTDGSGWIIIKDGEEVSTLQIKEFANQIGLGNEQIADLNDANIQILSRDGWTKLKNITKRSLGNDELLYTIKTRTGLPLRLTREHRLPIIRNGEEKLLEVADIQVGDQLLSSENILLDCNDIDKFFINLSDVDVANNIDIRIKNISPLKNYLKYKYGISSFEKYAEDNFEYEFLSTTKDIHLKDFRKLCKDFALPYDLLCKLNICASGSRHRYPLLVSYSPELAKLYAYIYSDGSIYVNESEKLYQLNFSNTNEEIIDDFIRCFESCFGLRLSKNYPSVEYAKNNSPCIRVYCCDKIITSLFRDYAGGFMNGCDNIRIPDFVMNGDESVKYAYLSAAIDSDGNINSHNINITSCCKSYCEQLIMILSSLGYHATIVNADVTGSSYHFNKSNRTGTRNFDSYKVNIYRDDEKALLYSKMSTIKYFDGYSYNGISKNFNEECVISITNNTKIGESVYDLETTSHWFILNNYVSHNCLSIPFDKLLADGFNTRQTDVRPAQSISTAFQLIAVLSQLQSLQQFGGVSATHLDWTMVPYVRKSFFKHFCDGCKYIEGYEMPDPFIPENWSIDSYEYKKRKKAYKYAMDMTEREIYQGAEGLYHNLK